MSHRYTRIAAAVSLGLLSTALVSRPAQATNGYQLIGIGSYQKSLAGAVTAHPGSAMTAVTNPAGMARIGRRADFSMEAFMPSRQVDFGAMGGQSADSAADVYGVPAIGWTAPVGNDGKVYFGGGMYGTSGMGVDYAQTQMAPGQYWDGYSNIAFWQMAPTLAWDANDRLSLGVSLNLDYQSVAFRQRVTNGAGTTYSNFDLSRASSVFGYGVSLGMMYDVNDRLTVGAAYKSKQVFNKLKYNLAYGDIDATAFGGGPFPAGTYTLGLDYPQQAALGLAWRATRQLTVSTDVKWIDWASTMDKLTVNGPGPYDMVMNTGWSSQTVVAVGLDYAVNSRLSVRAGVNHASSPIDANDVKNNLILPAIVETHYTVGAQYRMDDHWDIGFHYMYVPKKTLTAAPSANPADLPGAKISLSEKSMGVNLGYRF
ncbi:MAG TPA: outer membrane protein transport protein [Gammaproteobacteria bacterium]|nr:outer membrane protein transport protein [Gammaproteobacteria bacterium]